MTRPVAIVTGANRGIGLACANALAETGFDIAAADLTPEPSPELAASVGLRGARLAYRRCDIANLANHPAVIETALDAFGHIDCLVNNAGIGAVVRGDLLELKPENFDRVIDVNLRGTVFFTQAVAKAMLAQPPHHPRSGSEPRLVAVDDLACEKYARSMACPLLRRPHRRLQGGEPGAVEQRLEGGGR